MASRGIIWRLPYKSAEKEINALNRKLDNLKQYLDRDSQDHQTSDRKAERNQNTL